MSGVFSAFLVNDAICLVLAPLVLELTLALRRNPVPYLLAVAMASNVGSTATITGNPQNIMIGSFSQIPYAQFAGDPGAGGAGRAGGDGGVAGAGSTGRSSAAVARLDPPAQRIRGQPYLGDPGAGRRRWRWSRCSLPASHRPRPRSSSGALLLLTRRVKSARVYAEIDWSLLLMFAGLFIIVAGRGTRAAHAADWSPRSGASAWGRCRC